MAQQMETPRSLGRDADPDAWPGHDRESVPDRRRIRHPYRPRRQIEPAVSERWIGTYASTPDRLMLVDQPADRVRLVAITSGTGASTSFAIAEEVIDDLMAEN